MNSESRPSEEVLAELDERRHRDPDIHGHRLFGLVYPSGHEDLEGLIREVYERFIFANALNPLKFAEIARFEREVIDMSASLVHRPVTDKSPGSMTSGGTESILMSMLVNRERARRRGVERPVILAPASAHPAYAKAAHYFDLDLVTVPLDSKWRCDVEAVRDALSERTAVVVASAFNYPYGVMDPVEELAALAAQAGAGCHVDACIGGFVLPFLEHLGRDVAPFDFRVAGVTSMSSDIHKYGYVPKGASVVVYRDDDWFTHQVFLYDEWGSGIYGSGAIAGARPASPVACSWAVINYLGVDGYSAIMSGLMDVVARFTSAVDSLDGVEIVGEPIGPVVALRSDSIDLYAVGDAMDDRGWHLNRNTEPRGLHLMFSPAHARVIDELIADLTACVDEHGEARGGDVRYS